MLCTMSRPVGLALLTALVLTLLVLAVRPRGESDEAAAYRVAQQYARCVPTGVCAFDEPIPAGVRVRTGVQTTITGGVATYVVDERGRLRSVVSTPPSS